MQPDLKLVRLQWGLLGGWLILFLLYETGYRAMSRQAVDLDRPLVTIWKELEARTRGNDALQAGNLEAMRQSLQQIRDSLATLRRANQLVRDRVAPDRETQARLREPFQLLDFEKSRLQLIGDLRRLADSKRIGLEPAVAAGYPEFSSGLARPAQLWAQLAIVHQALVAAVMSGPRVILSTSALPVRLHLSTDGSRVVWEEFPVRLELAGPAEALLRFLQTVPLRAAECRAAGYGDFPAPKPALFVDRFILKNTAGQLPEARLEVVVSGFLFRNELR